MTAPTAAHDSSDAPVTLPPLEGLRVSHTGLCVSDLQRSLRFYVEGLGFEIAETYTAGNEVAAAAEITAEAKMTSQMVVKDGVKLELLWWVEPGSNGTPSTQRNQLGLTHLSFAVDDITAAEVRLVGLGATVIESTRTHVETGSISVDLLFLTDPDGTRIELVKWDMG
jgi:catechol 2,3-dioxygenase-like lactoylglutathione lyase family enzyme